MRLSTFVVLVAGVAGLLSSGNALSTENDDQVSKMVSTNSVKQYDGEAKRSLRAAEDDDEEERGNWTLVAEKIAAEVKANEAKFVDFIRKNHQSGQVNGQVAYVAAKKLGYSKEQATQLLKMAGVL